MKTRAARLLALAAVLSLFHIQASFAQVTPERLAQLDAMVGQIKQIRAELGPHAQYLSAGGRNLLNLADHWGKLKTALGQRVTLSEELAGTGLLTTRVRSFQPIQVTTTTLGSTRFSGFTQNETSTAWCGNNAVVAFNDSGSFFESGGYTLDGYAQSTNANRTTKPSPTFADKGFPTPSGANTLMVGDPVVACTSQSDFYYSSLWFECTASFLGLCTAGSSGVAVSHSTDGGASFPAPVVAVQKDNTTHLIDKDWMTTDPRNPNTIYVTYTDFDGSGTSAACGSQFRTAIEVVASLDGGNTWSAPTVIQQVCSSPLVGVPSVEGSQVAIGPLGQVYVAWENYDATGAREIDIAVNNGTGFEPPILVHRVNCAGDCSDIQGEIRINEFPSLAIGKGSNGGKLFVTWNDGDRPVLDSLSLTGLYNFTDIMLTTSSDGSTWSTPVKVNSNSPSATDHFEPAVAADKSGNVAVCFYDRRNDPNNFLIDRYCARSTNGGASFGNSRITAANFPSVVNQDVLLAQDYMGDYDTLASDALNLNSGFRGAFGNNSAGNPNVQANVY